MHRTDDASAALALPAPLPVGPKPNGFFADNTIVQRDFMNAITEEVCKVIEAEGIVLDKLDNNQLLAAIKKLVRPWSDYGHVPEYRNAAGIKFTGIDLSTFYEEGMRVKVIGPLTGTVYGIITSSIFIANESRVSFVLDSGTIINETLTLIAVADFYSLNNIQSLPYGLHGVGTITTDMPLTKNSVSKKLTAGPLTNENQITDSVRLRGQANIYTPSINELTHIESSWFRVSNANPVLTNRIMLRNLHSSKDLQYTYIINAATVVKGTLLSNQTLNIDFSATDYYEMFLVIQPSSNIGETATLNGYISGAYNSVLSNFTENNA